MAIQLQETKNTTKQYLQIRVSEKNGQYGSVLMCFERDDEGGDDIALSLMETKGYAFGSPAFIAKALKEVAKEISKVNRETFVSQE